MKQLHALALSLLIGSGAVAQSLELETVVSGLTNPVDLAHCGDSRIFIVERAGIIRILQPNGQVLATPFLDISGPVHSGGGEQGLLGLAFHPNYAQNGFFYVYYCTGSGSGGVRVSRFTVGADPNVANVSSELVLWELTQPFTNHKGGDIDFGPDGYLYFAPGDGGDQNDPGNRAQNMSLGYGKMHRINVNSGSPYSIPTNNPFANDANQDTLRTIFASGLRNPFRFGFDRQTGDLWIGDVGQGQREEIDRIAAGNLSGPNFGWRCREGVIATPGVTTCTGNFTEPIIDQTHANGWCSIIGGRVYRGSRYPNLVGRYIYTDYCLGQFRSIRPNGGGWLDEALVSTSFGLACIAEDVTGELYAVNTETGVISRLIDNSAVVRVSPKVFLDGAYNTTTALMNDGLRTGALVPATEPYTTSLGYSKVAKGGGETLSAGVLNTTGNNAVVDWVRVELRPVGQPGMIAATAHGVVQRDGDVLAADNTTPLQFKVGAGTYHVVVRHRNHLGVMTAAGVALTATTTTVDFTLAGTNTYGTNARKTINTTLRSLWSGNALVDNVVRYTGTSNDRDPLLMAVGSTTPNASLAGYNVLDVNLDGVTKYTGTGNDRDPILINVGSTTPNFTVQQQLP